MGSFGTVAPPPLLVVELGGCEGQGRLGIEVFVALPAAEAPDEGVLDRLARLDEAKLDSTVFPPRIERATAERAAVV